jgi:hypothetical protein
MKPRSLKTCFSRGVLLAALALTTVRAFGQEDLKLSPVIVPPLFGTFFSMQRPDYPPLPWHPFPELPLYEIGIKHVYVFDDRTVDYAALRLAQEPASGTGVISSANGVMLAGGLGTGQHHVLVPLRGFLRDAGRGRASEESRAHVPSRGESQRRTLWQRQ